ncbi:MAG: putative LPS assembly protein LptD [Bacteroidales bacterium]
MPAPAQASPEKPLNPDFHAAHRGHPFSYQVADAMMLQPMQDPRDLNPVQPPDTIAPDTILDMPARQQGSATILGAQVDYSSTDSIYFDLQNQKVFLYGEANLVYDEIHLQAAYVEIDFNRNEVFARGMPDSLGIMQGLPVFTEGQQSFKSKEMRYNFATKQGRTIGVITEEADGFIHGDIVKMHPNQIIHAQDGKYTTCDASEPHFHIAFRRAKIIPNDKIITSLAYLVIEGVPLPLVLPFGFFPNKKGQASGVLFPSFTESANRGFGLERGGFYWGINEHMDLALRGNVYSRGSWEASVESTYNKRYRFRGGINLGYSINIEGETGMPNYQRRRDFRIRWNHSQDPKARPNSNFSASVNAGSSGFTQLNQVSDQEYLTNTFSSSITYSRRWAGGYNLSTSLNHSQNTQNRRVDMSLPEIAFSKSRFYPLRRAQPQGALRWYENINMTYNMNASNKISSPDSLLFTQETLSKMSNGVRHTVPISHSFRMLQHLNMSNSVNYTERWYFRTISRNWDPNAMVIQGSDTLYGRVITDTIPGFRAARDFSFSSSINTRLYGMMQFTKGPVRALRHVMTPSVSFSMRPDFADPFWGYYQQYYNPRVKDTIQYSVFEGGIYGVPQANRSGNISFSLTNNLEMKVRNRRDSIDGDQKITLIDNLTVSGGYDVARDSLNFNDISLSARTRLFGRFDITFGSSWTVYDTDSLGRRINRYVWDTRGKPLQLNNTSWAFALNYSLNSDAQAPTGAGRDQPRENGMPGMPLEGQAGNGMQQPPEEAMELTTPTGYGLDLAVPWNLVFSYNFRHGSRYQPQTGDFQKTLVQTLGVTGDVNLTPNWRIGISSGYDFDQKEITYTRVNLYRDLHCWEMTIDWIPFGYRKSYSFTLRVKSSVLQDLKLTRRTSHLDRQLLDF